MTLVTIDFDTETTTYIKGKTRDVKSYIINLIKEDMLFNSIKDSKSSGIHSLNNLDDLDK